tara:strand:- start:3597 stop:4868 length:1272 start_codon:yes stop_codon:yes gene_type:complete
MMELRQQQTAQGIENARLQELQRLNSPERLAFEKAKRNAEMRTLTQPKRELIDYPLGGGQSVKLIQITNPDGSITFEKPTFDNLLGNIVTPPEQATGDNRISEVIKPNGTATPVMPSPPSATQPLTLADRFEQAGIPVTRPNRKNVGNPYRQGDAVYQVVQNPDGSREPVKISDDPRSFGLTRPRDPKAASLLSPADRQKYYDPNTTENEFQQLHNKALVALGEEERAKANQPAQGERDAAFFYSQMMQAAPTIDELEQDENSGEFLEKITSTEAALKRNVAIGEGFKSQKEKQYLNAASAWVAGKLRQESGAAIGEDEFAQEYARFFPVIGDSAETIAKKRAGRKVAQDQMLQIAGRAAPQIAESETSSSQTPPRSDSQSFSLPPKLLEMTYEQLGQLDDENLERLGLYEAVINRMNELEGK